MQVAVVAKSSGLAFLVGLTLAGCAWWSALESSSIPPEVAGQWEGWMAGRLGRAPASLTVQPNGRYEGQLHLTDGDRPFSGSIVGLGDCRGRFVGTEGDGIVTVQREDGRVMLKFVLDGGGSSATFVRLRQQ